MKEHRSALWIGSASFAAYAGCYFGKNLLSALMPQMENQEALGNMLSIFLLTYGFGQLFNGILGNRISPKYMISFGLGAAGLSTLLFPACLPTPAIGYLLCGISGFFCSMLWGPLSKMVGENTLPKTGKLLLSLLTVASMLGTFATHLLAILASLLQNAVIAFYLGGGVMLLLALIWLPVYQHMEKCGIVRTTEKEQPEQKEKTALPKSTLHKTLLRPTFFFMVAVTMLNGVIRNAVSSWFPTFLTQYLFLDVATGSLISSLLPLLNIGGIFASLWLTNHIKKSERVICAWLFALSLLCFGAVFCIPHSQASLSVVCMLLANAAMSGVCNLIFSVYLLRFRTGGMLSGIAGFLDFASYFSAAAASFVFTYLSNSGNWGTIVLLWCGITLFGAIFSIFSEKSDNRKTDL